MAHDFGRLRGGTLPDPDTLRLNRALAALERLLNQLTTTPPLQMRDYHIWLDQDLDAGDFFPANITAQHPSLKYFYSFEEVEYTGSSGMAVVKAGGRTGVYNALELSLDRYVAYDVGAVVWMRALNDEIYGFRYDRVAVKDEDSTQQMKGVQNIHFQGGGVRATQFPGTIDEVLVEVPGANPTPINVEDPCSLDLLEGQVYFNYFDQAFIMKLNGACLIWCNCFFSGSFTGSGIPPVNQNTIATACCPERLLPANLVASFEGVSAGCTCLPADFPIVYDQDAQWWGSLDDQPPRICGYTGLSTGTPTVRVECVDGLWRAVIDASDVIVWVEEESSCDPLELVFTVELNSLCSGTATLVIREGALNLADYAMSIINYGMNADSGLYQDLHNNTTPATADGDRVGTAYDFNGTGKDFWTLLNATRATLRTNVINGHNALEFDGTEEYLKRDHDDVNTRTIIAVCKDTSSSASHRTLSGCQSSEAGGLDAYYFKTRDLSDVNALMVFNSGGTAYLAYTPQEIGSWIILAGRVKPDGTIDIWKNGVMGTPDTLGGPLVAFTHPTTIGCGMFGDNQVDYFQGLLAWIGIWDTALDDATMNAVFAQLNSEYAVY